ncbi:MAG: DUF2800 domain-containing protein, partial [Akkermansia sp.]|nr:DUF2800 domain-containing protein [Akkermansia sp.]
MAELNDHSTRAHALLSASAAHRWLNCPPSAVAAELYPRETSEYAEEGTLAHEVAEAMARNQMEDLVHFKGHVTEEMLGCAEAYAEYIQEQVKSDDAVVLLEQRVDFSPWVPEGFGTCDCIIIQGNTLTIIDYKYGKGVAVDAVDNPQLMLYALGALNDFGIAYDIDLVEMHIFQPRINNVSKSVAVADDLTAWAESTVKPVAEQAAQGAGEFKPGSWCQFCPHAGKCRTLTETCTEYVETHGLRQGVPVLAPYEMAKVLEMEPLVTLWLKRVKAQVLTSMLNGEQVPGYKVVSGRPGNRKWTDEL